jgi:2-polyprenyl-3-methyl-5-hydroxy-6-metoxy-1,4-benzoquinol methylase
MPRERDEGGTDYVFDRTRTNEERRLEEQSRIIDPITERCFVAAGLGPGMHALEVGTGAGDVALLVAGLVGTDGSVTGVDASGEALATARDRMEAAGIMNATFVRADIRHLAEALTDRAPFDALVGRFVLQFVPQPGRVLHDLVRHVRPGGLVCFQECDVHYTWAFPATPLWERTRSWFHRAMEAAGVEQRMGLRLFETFLDAGLPEPEMRLEAYIGGGSRAAVDVWAGVVRAVMPTLEAHGIATEEEVGPATLADRLTDEIRERRGVVINIPVVGAWAHTS